MSDDEQPRVATLNVTNEAWTDEIQLLIGLLERKFSVDAQMADGRLHIHRLPQVGSSDSCAADEDDIPVPDEHRDIDELLEGMIEAVRDMKEGRTTSDTEELRKRIKMLRQSDQDIEEDRTSTLGEVREELDGDGAEDEADDIEEQVDAAVDSFENKLDRMDDAVDPDESDDGTGPSEDETDESGSEDPTCQYCGDSFHPKVVKPHERHCPENPDNDSEESNEDAEESAETGRYRCGGCGDTFVSERGVKIHQGRSRDCTGADIEPVEQTDTSESAGSAADPTGDETPDATDAEDDSELDPEVGAIPIDPDTVDEAVVADEETDPVPEDEQQEDKHRVRREPSTVREVVDGPAGQYLCLDCGFVSLKAFAARNHDFRAHGGYTRGDGEDYRQLDRVPADELTERWLVIYKNVGSTWTHPKIHEARKNGIVHVLEKADYFLDVSEIREQLNDYLEVRGEGETGKKRQVTYEQLTDDPGYLDELVDAGRIERDGETYGVDAMRAAKMIETTA